MKRISTRALVLTGIAAVAAFGVAGVAYAQSNAVAQATPKNWNYEIKDGKRVPKGNRTTNADGSWREEIKQGACTTVKESTAQGEVKISRKCS